MAFYLNEFKQHLRTLSNKVDHPYDEPARRNLNNQKPTSIEETYKTMNNASFLSEQDGMSIERTYLNG